MAALDGTGDARWGENSWPHAESVPETSTNLVTAARLCTEAAPSCLAIPPEECSRLLQYEGFLFWSHPAEFWLRDRIGCGVPSASAFPFGERSLGTSFNLVAFVCSSPESGP